MVFQEFVKHGTFRELHIIGIKTIPKAQKKRGPIGYHSDCELLSFIKQELIFSPFQGEGYRKIHTHLRFKGIRTSPKRVMQIMREHNLQEIKRERYSPYINILNLNSLLVYYGISKSFINCKKLHFHSKLFFYPFM